MASQVLKRGQAVVRVPSRAIGERAFANEASLLVLLPGAAGGNWIRSSLDALPSLRAVTLLVDPRDVTLLRVKLPPLSGARLRQAIPNAVEDLLLQDAHQCAFALGPTSGEGERLVAVIDRGWLEFVTGAFERRGLRVLAVWPAQLALPIDDDAVFMACVGDGIAVRTGRLDGFGWHAGTSLGDRTDALVMALEAALGERRDDSLASLPSEGAAAATRAVVACEDETWQLALQAAADRTGFRIDVQALSAPVQSPVDLLAARPGTRAARLLADVDWRAWRLPAGLAAASVLTALLGLNLHWSMLARERDDLRRAIESTYRRAFPEAQVIVDPVLQMERQVAAMRARAGQAGPDDFLPLMARFSQALGDQASDALAGVEYREGRLRVRFQPGRMEARELREALSRACQRLGLQLRFEADREPTATVSLLQ